MSSDDPSAEDSIVITGVGMLTALGQTAQSYAASRAGLRSVQEWDAYYALGLDEEFDPREPIDVALAPLPVSGMYPWNRLVELTLPAAEEAIQNAQLERADLAATQLHVCLSPPSGEDQESALGDFYLRTFYQSSALPPMREHFAYFQGHAAGGAALADAITSLRSGACQHALIGGAETFLDTALLEQLDQEMRIKSARSVDGYNPGEASAFCVLERQDSAVERDAPMLIAIAAVGLAAEPHPLKSTKPCIAQGLSAAIRTALSSGGEESPADGWVISDFNGERHRAQEWGLTLTRLGPLLGEEVELWHPAENFGDVGAATVPLLLAMVAQAHACGEAPATSSIILASSDGPDRCAILTRAVVNIPAIPTGDV